MKMESNDTETTETFDGPIWAAILAAAIGCACFGALVDAAEASRDFSKSLSFYDPTGDLSGKSTLAIVAWLAAWLGLQLRWKKKNLQKPATVMLASIVLILSALLMTFPPFINLFG